MYLDKSCNHLSSQVNYCKVLALQREPQDLLEKKREDMAGGTSILFTKKAVVDETFIRDSTN